jgi:hypothetical protein
MDITMEKFAVSDMNGEMEFWEGSINSLSRTNAELFSHDNKKTTVKSITIDEYFKDKNIDTPYFMMTDTEGAESLVFKGAEKTFRSNPPLVLFVEVIDICLRNMGSSKEELISLLEGYGYKPYCFGKHKIFEYKSGKDTESPNMLFLKDTAVTQTTLSF